MSQTSLNQPPSSLVWQTSARRISLAERVAIMGILNVTPDSFSDGGRFSQTERAVEQGLALERDGADIIDIGGESTRPGAEIVSEDEELRRVIPVIEKLRGQVSIPISIDTSKARVAREAMAAGAEIINDVTGLEGDPGMMEVAIESRAGVCAMHMRGNPRTMQINPEYTDVVKQTYEYLRERRDWLERAGIERERVCLDPGIGFGKTHAHTFEMLRRVDEYLGLERPILIGHSRKGFIAKAIGDSVRDRTAGTVGVALACVARGIRILRVHDVLPLRDALTLFELSGGAGEEGAIREARRILGS